MQALASLYQGLLVKLYHIRPGEFRRASLMMVNILLIISTLLVLKPTVTSVFLSEFGVEELPFAFVLVAIAAAFITRISARAAVKFPLQKLMRWNYIGCITCLVIFAGLLAADIARDVVIYVFYVWVTIFALLIATQFWMHSNVVFNDREAKRIFPFLGAGAIAGGILGGYFTGLVVELIGNTGLVLSAACMLGVAMFISQRIWAVTKNKAQGETSRSYSDGNRYPLKLILRSRHLGYLALIVGTGVITARLVDYQFSALASEAIQDPRELTQFFGFWFSTFNVISLVIQLLLTRALIKWLGVGRSLLILPGIILIAALGLLVAPVLAFAILLKLADGSLKQSVHKAGIELLIVPVPSRIKAPVKTFIDVFVDSVATGIGGLILILVIRGFQVSSQVVTLIIIGLALVWFGLALGVRREYIGAFKSKLKASFYENRRIVSLERLRTWIDTNQYAALQYAIEEDLLPEIVDADLIKELLSLPSRPLNIAAMRLLISESVETERSDFELLVSHPEFKVRVMAINYLMRTSRNSEIAIAKHYMEDANPLVSFSALVSFAMEVAGNREIQRLRQFKEGVRTFQRTLDEMDEGPDKDACQISVLYAMGMSRNSIFLKEIIESMEDASPLVAHHAVVAAGHSRHPSMRTHFLNLLVVPEHKDSVLEALKSYGQPTLKILRAALGRNDVPISTILEFPRVVRDIPGQRCVDFLMDLIEYPDPRVFFKCLLALQHKRIQNPHLKFQRYQLTQKLKRRVRRLKRLLAVVHLHQQALSRMEPDDTNRVQLYKSLIFRIREKNAETLRQLFLALSLRYPYDDIVAVYKGLVYPNKQKKTVALELLDSLLNIKDKKAYMPLLEAAIATTPSMEHLSNMKQTLPTFDQAYLLILGMNDLSLIKCIVEITSGRVDPEMKKIHRLALERERKLIRQRASRSRKGARDSMKWQVRNQVAESSDRSL